MPRHLLKCCATAIATRTRAFVADERGSLSYLTLVMLPVMLVAGGMAVDFIHFETMRVRLQSTLDRAVLAAASLNQSREPEDVVHEFFAKAGFQDQVRSVTVNEGLNFREVSATADLAIDTFFLHMIGWPEMLAPAVGTAIENRIIVEIAMVLDVSGSMDDNQRLPRLKVAAKEFVDALLEDDFDERLVSISLVPFSTQVSAGTGVLEQLSVSNEHTYSHCVDFETGDFRTTAIPSGQVLKRTGHFDPWMNSALPLSIPVCPPASDASRHILAFSDDAAALRARIDSLHALGATSIDIGAKWGAYLLDPSSRPLVDAQITAGATHPDFAGRPSAYDEPQALKVLIVMSDGANTEQFTLRSSHATGNSDVWRDPETNRTSVKFTTAGVDFYFSPHDGLTRPLPYDNDGNAANGQGDPVRLTKLQLWKDYSLFWHAHNHWYKRTGSSADRNREFTAPRESIGAVEKDNRTADICDAAKATGTIVFTIGFEADDHGDATLRDCASSDAHFFDVEGLEIEEAFNAISSNINHLRLSQ